MFDNRLHTVVARVAPFVFQFDTAERQVKIVVDHDEIAWKSREMPTQVSHCFAAGIHIGERQG
jgi:hypothetical protein